MNRTLVISSIFLLISCGIGLDDINDDSKRNADWAWHVDADGIGKWVPVRQKENDVPDGDVTWFYDNGFTHSFTRMVNNERVDTTWYYSHLEERKLIKIHIEKEGVESWWFPENGDFIKYTKKGDLFESGEVVANKHGSHWTVYHSNGKPSFIEKRNLESGKRNYSNYFVTGQISDTSEFKNGLVHGISKIWNKRGVLIEEAEWEEGAESGKVRHYYSDGTLKLETDYVRGRKHGLQHVFFKNGQLESTSNW
ncbi:MAG: toxin-antitoxin system YwqK family antitoxin, partial [Saprospiraceae bacterium]